MNIASQITHTPSPRAVLLRASAWLDNAAAWQPTDAPVALLLSS
jgi:hypothetical protein